MIVPHLSRGRARERRAPVAAAGVIALASLLVLCTSSRDGGPPSGGDVASTADADATVAASPTAGTYALVSLGGRGRCLDAESAGGVATGAVQTWQCTSNNDNQRWRWTGDTFVASSGACIDGAPSAGGDARLVDCGSPSAHQLTREDDTTITNGLGACLDAVALGVENGARVKLLPCTGAVSQRWDLRAPLQGPSPAAQVWMTTPDQRALFARQPDVPLADAREDLPTITVDDSAVAQQIEGFGAALTDSSAWLMANALDDAARADLITKLFDPVAGIGLDYVRIPLGASDFSLSHYTYDDLPRGESDPALEHFSVAHDEQYILPAARAIAAANPRVRFMGSPWSAPAWMKTSQSLVGGSLEPSAYAAYAAYLLKTVEAFEARGVPLATLTIQNEPLFEAPDYPSMRMEANDQAAFVGEHLGPLFAGSPAGSKVGLLAYDHNWSEPGYPITVLSSEPARKFLKGSAFHCYRGSVEQQSLVHAAFPDHDIVFSECTGFGDFSDFGSDLIWGALNILIGTTRNWASTVLYFNLLLDQSSGPHAGGCSNCRGVTTVNRDNGAVSYGVEFYLLAHMSKFVTPGAHRVGSGVAAPVTQVVFLDPDGTHVLVVLNAASLDARVQVEDRGKRFVLNIPAGGLVTATW